MTSNPLITLQNITKTHLMGDEKITILQIPLLTIQAREWVSITGPSGSGKTTLLHILGCLDIPTTGTYQLNERMITKSSATERAHIRNTEFGFIFQRFHLLPSLSVEENIALPLHYAGIAPHERTKRVAHFLSRVELTHKAKHYPHQLSGGQQQRVAIARALVMHPHIICADEPTGNLDSKTSGIILALLQEMYAELKPTILLVTHDNAVAEYGTRQLHIKDGKIA